MAGEIKVQTYVQIRTDLVLSDGTKLGTITPIVTEIQGIKATILHFEFERALEPSDLKVIEYALSQLKKWMEGELIIISGRAPVWLFVAVAHVFHGIISAVACLDPKLQGAVIVMTHTRKFEVGQVIKLPQELLEKLVQIRA